MVTLHVSADGIVKCGLLNGNCNTKARHIDLEAPILRRKVLIAEALGNCFLRTMWPTTTATGSMAVVIFAKLPN
jgi:hypothetical protein